jgi:hypothetical protein
VTWRHCACAFIIVTFFIRWMCLCCPLCQPRWHSAALSGEMISQMSFSSYLTVTLWTLTGKPLPQARPSHFALSQAFSSFLTATLWTLTSKPLPQAMPWHFALS